MCHSRTQGVSMTNFANLTLLRPDYYFQAKICKKKLKKNKISKRIEAIRSKNYEFVQISINWEYTIRNKIGEIVDCGRSWKNDNLHIEECSKIFKS